MGFKHKEIQQSSEHLSLLVDIVARSCYYGTQEQVKRLYEIYKDFILMSLNSTVMREEVTKFRDRTPMHRTLIDMLNFLCSCVQRLPQQRANMLALQVDQTAKHYLPLITCNYKRDLCYTCLTFLADNEQEYSFSKEIIKYSEWQIRYDDVDTCLVEINDAIDYLQTLSPHDLADEPWKFTGIFRTLISVFERFPINSNAAESVAKVVVAEKVLELYKEYWLLTDEGLQNVDNLLDAEEKTDKVRSSVFNIASYLDVLHNAARLLGRSQHQQTFYKSLYKFLLGRLKDPTYLEANKLIGPLHPLKSLLVVALRIIYQWVRNLESSVMDLRSANGAEVICQYRDFTDDTDQKTICLLLLGYILDENDDKSIVESSYEELTHLVKECEIAVLGKSVFTAEELFEGINRIAVVDVNKVKLVNAGYVKVLVSSMKDKYPFRQQILAVKGIWNLAFNEETTEHILEEKGCKKGEQYKQLDINTHIMELLPSK